ncbi:cell wall-active antibiotics response protein LiaF [Bacillus sp. 2205SS5-2]|uniref:cell wall-active antibiotics response protein LiaF n=1 Tax=Bacillus sp. 2205SS5-2 TaxID=3109031 RepID=UPI0030071D7A
MKKKSRKHGFFLLLLLVVGVVLLLLNIGVISFGLEEIFKGGLPYFITFIGVYLFLNAFRQRSSTKLFIGMVLSTYGGLLLLDLYELMTFSYAHWLKLWPLLIIFIAVKGIFFSQKKDDFQYSPHKKNINIVIDTNEKSSDIYKMKSKKIRENHHNGFIGDLKYNEDNWSLEPMSLSHFIGDVFVDFGKAYIPDGETPIEVKSWIGDIKILIPEDIGVEVFAKVNLGDIKLLHLKSSDVKPKIHYRSPNYDEAVKKIQLTLQLNIGSIRVDKV